MASTVDAVLEDMPASVCQGCGERRGIAAYGGRWNSRGVRMVYASTILSLAAAEAFVNLEPNRRPADLISIEGDVPDAIVKLMLDVEALPAGWYERRDESLRRFGDEWVRDGRSAVFLVPSAAIRVKWNVLLNPAHAEFAGIALRDPKPFEFDSRMLR